MLPPSPWQLLQNKFSKIFNIRKWWDNEEIQNLEFKNSHLPAVLTITVEILVGASFDAVTITVIAVAVAVIAVVTMAAIAINAVVLSLIFLFNTAITEFSLGFAFDAVIIASVTSIPTISTMVLSLGFFFGAVAIAAVVLSLDFLFSTAVKEFSLGFAFDAVIVTGITTISAVVLSLGFFFGAIATVETLGFPHFVFYVQLASPPLQQNYL